MHSKMPARWGKPDGRLLCLEVGRRFPTRTFRPLHLAVENVFDLVGNNVIAVQWDNRPVNKAGEEFYVRGVTVSRAHRGKIVENTTYVLDYEVLPRLWGKSGESSPAVGPE